MRARTRVDRLAEAVGARAPAFAGPPVELWLPYNGRGDKLPGRYPFPGTNAVMVIYETDGEGREVPPPEAPVPSRP